MPIRIGTWLTKDPDRLREQLAQLERYLREQERLIGDLQTAVAATPTTSAGVTDGDKGDITVSVGGTTWTIDNDAVTLAKLENAAANSFLGNNTGAATDGIWLTATQATAMLDVATSALKGLAPASGGGTTNFLRADLTWAAPPGGSGTSIEDQVSYVRMYT